MTGLSDLHVHLLAGLDDGPRTWSDAIEMCRQLVSEGCAHSVALAHQSERWPLTPEQIRGAAAALAERLEAEGVPLRVVPSAEIMAVPELALSWSAGRYLSVADRGKYLLVEMPNQVFVDLRRVVSDLACVGMRVILAHPERHQEFLHDAGRIEELIELGCLVQTSSASVTDPRCSADGKAIRDWFKRGCVHLLGSDGHSPRSRRPQLAAAADRIRRWVGTAEAERICATNGQKILDGGVIHALPPAPKRSWWALLGR
jgi:protein-tyrosine phosphatase